MFLNIFLLVFALCLDTFVASAAYGTNQVHLSAGQIAVINGICSLCLGVSLMFGTLLDSWIPESFTRGICFISLMLLGFLKLADSSIKRYLRRHRQLNKNIRFSFSQLRFIINIYSDPLEADADESHDLTWKEVIFFSLAMSIDSLAAGTMAAFMKISVPITVITAFVMGVLFTCMGLLLGRKISAHCPRDLSWIGVFLFIVLAILKF